MSQPNGDLKRQNVSDAEDSTAERKKRNLTCEVCGIKNLNEHDMQIHVKGKSHKQKESRNRQQQSDDKCGIFVKGFPPDTQEKQLIDYFSIFGKVVWAHMGHNFLLLNFTEANAANKAVSKKVHYHGGVRLFVQYKESKATNARIDLPKPPEVLPEVVMQNLEDIQNVEEAANTLKNYLQSDSQECFQNYNQICNEIHYFLAQSNPYCQVMPFGSTASGLSFNQSDIDIYIANIKKNDSEKEEVNCLHKIKSILMRSQNFINLFVIPNAKIPLLKCVHKQTGTHCDINIKNMLGVCNTKLIEYYAHLDEKIKLLMIILKYWAKTHKLTGQNHLMTNYSLIMMVIFYLQSKFNVPSVRSMQRLSEENLQNGWNGSFTPNYHSNYHFPSLLLLLKGFFDFYLNFNYSTDVICPYLGEVITKSEFETPENLNSDHFSLYKKYVLIYQSELPLKINTSICVQDPFEHTRNTVSVVSESNLTIFISFCDLGKTICNENRSILARLVKEKPQNCQKLQYVVNKQFLQFGIHTPAKKIMKYFEAKANAGTRKPEKVWFEDFVNFTKMYLTDFLTMNVQPNEKSEKEHAYMCSARINFWDGRRATKKNMFRELAKMTTIEQEQTITKHLKKMTEGFQIYEDIIKFEMDLEFKGSQVCIVMRKTLAYKKCFQSFANIFLSYFPIVYENYLKDLCEAGRSISTSQNGGEGSSTS